MSEPVSIVRRAERWFHVLTSHRPSQLGWRAFFLVQRRLFPLLPKSVYTSAEPMRRRVNAEFDAVLDRQLAIRQAIGDPGDRADRLLRGEFRFLNESRQLSPTASTELHQVAAVSHLWRFHLHYQEHLLDLLAADRGGTHPGAADRIWPTVDAWMRMFPITRPGVLGDAWHPFCLSRRIPVWLLLWHAGAIPEEGADRFARSLEAQSRYLERHLEWDLRGNHLLENLKTVALVGAFGNGEAARYRLAQAGRHLDRQLTEQLLPSGEHFERSPMYHAQILAAVLDVRDATAEVDASLSQRCQSAALRMSGFLNSILHPDGQVPLLSDSAIGETPDPGLLIAAAEASSRPGASPSPQNTSPTNAQNSDYWTFRDGNDFVLFDRGDVGADDLPAHAHNDLLTVEVSLGGRRLIVDSGVFDYAEGEMRDYCRSTAAHNVLQIDGREQCDLWSRFRMGRRGHRRELASGDDAGFVWSAATHDAYADCGVPRIGRWIACRSGGPMIVADWADGAGRHQLDSRLHFAPEVQVTRSGDGWLSVVLGEVTGELRFHTPGTVSLEEGWHCPDFGRRLKSTVVRFSQSCELPAMVVWSFRWTKQVGEVRLDSKDPGDVKVVWEADRDHCVWSPRLMI